MQEKQKELCPKYVNKLPSRTCGLAFRIKMASPQKLLNISQCLFLQ